jgi:S-adenosylmethionine:tRNA ribosyltransferase-isomerase
MNIADFDFDLPPERIAQAPLAEREASRMLLLSRTSGAWDDRQFRDLPSLLRGDELMVLNNARVLPARLFGRRAGLRAEHHTANHTDRDVEESAPEAHAREDRAQADTSGAEAQREFLSSRIEVLLVRPLEAALWEALVRPGRKVPVGETIVFGGGELQAKVEWRGEFGLRRLRFSPAEHFEAEVRRLGHVPLPPYIRRPDEPSDRERYQTVYAREARAVAAPTAGLHFSVPILEQIRARGVEIVEITLEVGLGTFEPVRTEILEEHHIHREAYEISEAAAEAIAVAREKSRPILAVGTTVVRALEAAASGGGEIRAGRADAEIFLYPGKPFRVVSQLLTNFHLPKSTLLALVAGFAGRERVLAAYRHAAEAGYRFYSFGDCMWIR